MVGSTLTSWVPERNEVVHGLSPTMIVQILQGTEREHRNSYGSALESHRKPKAAVSEATADTHRVYCTRACYTNMGWHVGRWFPVSSLC